MIRQCHVVYVGFQFIIFLVSVERILVYLASNLLCVRFLDSIYDLDCILEYLLMVRCYASSENVQKHVTAFLLDVDLSGYVPQNSIQIIFLLPEMESFQRNAD